MKIGFDAKRLYCNFTGLGNYSRALVKNLHAEFPDNHYHLYTPKVKDRAETSFFRGHASLQTQIPDASFKAYWRSYGIGKQLKEDGVDLYHGLSNEIPFTLKKNGVKSVVTIHDLIFKVYPKTYSLIDRNIYDLKFKKSCQLADKVIAISNSTKQDIIKYYGIDSEKIEVIYQTCNPLFFKSVKEDDSVFKRYSIPSEYLLFVGSIETRKNLGLLLDAYQYLSSQERIPLVVVGGNRGYEKKFLDLIDSKGLQKEVLWISDLKDNVDLQRIYKKAMALIYPSFYEGFGLPVAEALLSKTPVITSNVSSLPEAGGPDSLYVDPNEPEELAEAIKRVLSDKDLRETMTEKGYRYAIENFAAKTVTSKLMKCYKDVMKK